MSPGNDTISLCGNRDGLSLKLQDYKDNLSVAFKSLNKSSFPGFSCRLKWGGEEVEDVKIEHTELLKGEFNSKSTLALGYKRLNGLQIPTKKSFKVSNL